MRAVVRCVRRSAASRLGASPQRSRADSPAALHVHDVELDPAAAAALWGAHGPSPASVTPRGGLPTIVALASASPGRRAAVGAIPLPVEASPGSVRRLRASAKPEPVRRLPHVHAPPLGHKQKAAQREQRRRAAGTAPGWAESALAEAEGVDDEARPRRRRATPLALAASR